MDAAGHITRGRSAAGGHDIEKTLLRMPPGVLNVGGQRYRAQLEERRAVDVDAIGGQFRPDRRVENVFECHEFAESEGRSGDGAYKQCRERPAIDHRTPHE
jgi:hypothetical protein